MPQFIKKPVVIEAVQWQGNNVSELKTAFGFVPFSLSDYNNALFIDTLEGVMRCDVGDWMVANRWRFKSARPHHTT